MHPENKFNFNYVGFKMSASVHENKVIVVPQNGGELPKCLVDAARTWFLLHQEKFNLTGLTPMDA